MVISHPLFSIKKVGKNMQLIFRFLRYMYVSKWKTDTPLKNLKNLKNLKKFDDLCIISMISYGSRDHKFENKR